jgi:hypothetical protein
MPEFGDFPGTLDALGPEFCPVLSNKKGKPVPLAISVAAWRKLSSNCGVCESQSKSPESVPSAIPSRQG